MAAAASSGSSRPTVKAQYQHEYREGKKKEEADLRMTVSELEKALARLQDRAVSADASPGRGRRPTAERDLMLSWKQVATALRTSARDAMVIHRDLRNNVDAHRDVLQRLATWVASVKHVPVAPSTPWGASNMSLARMPLVAHPASRRHGLDWLTQLMCHNTDAILNKYEFPPILSTSSAPFFRLLVDDLSSDSGVAVVCQYMKVFDGAIEDVVSCVSAHEIERKSFTKVTPADCARRRIDVASPDDETVTDLSVQPDVGSRALSYVRVTTRGMQKATCVLYRTFECESPLDEGGPGHGTSGPGSHATPSGVLDTDPPRRSKRWVVVGQSVPRDDKFPGSPMGRKTMSWYVFDQVAPHCTVLRHVYIAHGAVDPETGDSVSLEQEAGLWGCRIDPDELEHHKRELFRRYVHQMGAAAATQQNAIMERVDAALREGRQDHPSR